jgi:drug/metabolite transporter (DMT)-like permease
MVGGHLMIPAKGFNPGTLWMIASAASFSVMALAAKMLPEIPAFEKVFFRSLISVVMTIYALRAAGISLYANRKWMLLLRSIFGFGGLVCYFEAIDRLPLGTSVTIYNTTPIFAAIIGIAVLKEHHGPKRIASILLAIVGIAFIKGFSADAPSDGVIFGLLTAFFSSIAYSLVRILGKTENPLIIVLAFPLVSIPLSIALGVTDFRMPSGIEWWWLLALGVGTQGGQVCLTHGLRHHTATRATQIGFVGVIFAMFFGIFVGDGLPGSAEIVGALLVFLGIYLGAQQSARVISVK